MTQRSRLLLVWLATCAVLALGLPNAASANASEDVALPDVLTLDEAAKYLRVDAEELDRLAETGEAPGRRIGGQWRFSLRAIEAWLAADWTLITVAVPPDARIASLPASALDATVGAGREATPDTETRSPNQQIGEAPNEDSAEQIFLRDERILLSSGHGSFEAGFFYSRVDSDALVGLGGGISLASLEREFVTASFLGRYAVTSETEVFAGLTYTIEESGVFAGGRDLNLAADFDTSDIRFGVRSTLVHEGPGRPDVLLTIEGSAPIRNSSASVSAGLAFVKSYDPAVLFGSLAYTHTFSRDFSDVTLLEAKDRVDARIGYALAVNESLALTSALSGVLLFPSDFTVADLRSRELVNLEFGLTVELDEGLFVEPSVAFGLNGPADDYSVGLTIPYRF